MKLKTKASINIITNESEIFKGTEYANEPFSITFKELSPMERFNIVKKHSEILNGKEETNYVQLSVSQLNESIVEWTGIKDEEDNDIEITEDNILKIMSFDHEFTELLLSEINSFYSKKKK